jgi:hypothetical protein
MSSWGIISGKFGDAQVETSTMLNDRFMNRGEKDMILRVNLRLRYHEQAMIFSRVTSNDGRTGVGSGSVGPNDFPFQGIIQIN